MNAHKFAKEWIAAWNSHDLDRIMSHYADDFEISTPMIKMALGIDTGMIKGMTAIRDYWQKALDKMPDLKFELKEITMGVDSMVLYYKSVMNKHTIEVLYWNTDGKIEKVVAHYSS